MKDLTALCIRVSGLILIVLTLSYVPMYYVSYISQLENKILTYTLPILIPLFAGIILFKFPYSFSDTFIKINTENLSELNLNEYLKLGLILIGFVLLFFSLSDLVYHLTKHYYLKAIPEIEISLLTFDYPSLIATIVELLFSLILITKTKSVIRLIKHGNN